MSALGQERTTLMSGPRRLIPHSGHERSWFAATSTRARIVRWQLRTGPVVNLTLTTLDLSLLIGLAALSC
jgi:hypothetical protein